MEYGTLKNDSAFLAQISPVTNPAAIKGPLLLIQDAGDRDGSSEAAQLADSIRARGGSVEYASYDRVSGSNVINNRVSAATAVTSFLDQQLAARKPTGKK